MPRSLVTLLAKYVFILFLPVLILAILGYVSVFVSRNYAAEQTRRLARTSLYAAERVSQQLFDEAQATAIALGTAGPVLRALERQLGADERDLAGLQELELVRNLINTSAHARPHIQSIFVYLEKFDAVLTTNDEIQNVADMPDRSWLAVYEARPLESDAWASRRLSTPLGPGGPKEPVVSVYQRLFTLGAGEIPGVVVLNIRESSVQDQIRAAALTPSQRFVVFDGTGELLVSDLGDEELLTRVREAVRRGAASLSRGDTEYMMSTMVAPKTEWSYVTLAPSEVLFAPVARMARLNFSIVTLAVVAGLIIVGLMARRSARYIREVFDVIERAEAGLEMPAIHGHPTRGFGYITYHVLRAFVERQYYQLQLSERIYRNKALELLALQSQMNPHFLFNTLKAVNWQILSETGKPGPANEMIGSLAAIMKYALRSPTRFVPLRDEVENIENYVRIQSLRQQTGYELKVEIRDRLANAAMVPMTLQPLVENCIVHGFRGRRKGTIRISAIELGESLRLRVEDDGHGLAHSRLEELRRELESRDEAQGDHVGLVNTVRRVRLAFDAPVPVRVEPLAAGGLLVELELPVRQLSSETGGVKA